MRRVRGAMSNAVPAILPRVIEDGVTTPIPSDNVGRSPDELDWPIEFILAQHAQWIESKGQEGGPADLSGIDLRRVGSLAGHALTALIAPGATLSGVDLEGTLLQ